MSMLKTGSTMEVSEEDTSLLLAMQLASLSVLACALKVAVELDLLEIMKSKGPDAFVSPAELVAELSTNNPDAHNMLDRVLCLLATYSIVNCKVKKTLDGSVERLYSLAPVCKWYTKNDDGASLAPYLIKHQDKILMETRNHLTDVILGGGNTFKEAYNLSPFEYLAKDSRLSNVFNTAMSNASTLLMKKVVETYDGFNGLKTLVDVGGGLGASLRMILSKHPTIKGINFDLPHVIRDSPTYDDGVENVSGDMFVSIPKADAIFMKWILHDWNDTNCLQILKSCYEALPNNGKIIIVERVLTEDPSEGLVCNFLSDVSILTLIPGGKERTENEFHALAKQAGFRQSRAVCCVLPVWVFEFYKYE